MIRAYDKAYLDRARSALGRMLDFAVYDLKYDLHTFWQAFLKSDVCRRFENGDSSLLAGMSGVEMAYEVAGENTERIASKPVVNRSEEYWLGWSLAYYQWDTGLPFCDIFDAPDILKIKSLYSPYHEMDIRHFCDKMNEMYLGRRKYTNLKRRRFFAGLSQAELAKRADIPVRTIQQYEQGQKNINNARAEYVIRMAQALCCEPVDLIEKVRKINPHAGKDIRRNNLP